MRTKGKKKDSIRWVVGLDFSIARPGIVINDLSKKDGVTCICLDIKDKSCFEYKIDRFNSLASKILKRILPNKNRTNRTLIVMEDYAFGAKGRTFDIAEAASILKHRLHYNHKFPLTNIRFVSVQHLKMFVGGKGNCKKEIVIKEVFKRWEFDTDDDNDADAFVLMKIGLALLGKYPDLCEFQKDILQRVKDYNGKDKI